MVISSLLKYISSLTFEKLIVKSLVALAGSMQPPKSFRSIVIMSPSSVDFEEFSGCVIEALALLKAERPVEFRIVERNLRHILYTPRNVDYLAMYLQSCCYIPWNNWKLYSKLIRSRLLAAAIVHEGYHGECRMRFGVMACIKSYDVELKCRSREIRILKHFVKGFEGTYRRQFEERIFSLSSE